ncbi:MAG: hypothetical protein HS126_25080 [Anaerolineales bacterium]|nr:hypothetical protein [Anaerolineales bacterium]
MRRAVSLYGATIGSHNGGLADPVNPTLQPETYDYWHWGPDEALDTHPPGYASGKVYANASISQSFQDIEGWLSGLDNGRAGCGSGNNCPRVWVSPYFNSGRDGSFEVLEEVGRSRWANRSSVLPALDVVHPDEGQALCPSDLAGE